jgi:phosphatidylglycerophosphate synthase
MHSGDAMESETTTVKSGGARRPLQARQWRWAKAWAARLARKGMSPNFISTVSVGFALLATAAFVATRFVHHGWLVGLMMLVAIAGIQARLLCNLLDGMVAVEGGKGSKSGEIYNDFPDRLSDSIILIAAGYAAAAAPGAVELGWAAALLAVMTAYVRVLGRSIGSAVYFAGPMAKQHRMAVLTGACIVAGALACFWRGHAWAIWAALVVSNVGCVITVVRRLRLIVRELESR